MFPGISICPSREIQATEGEVTSPDFEPNSERTYPSDSDCTLAIDGGNNVKFKIKFEFFEVEEDEDSKLPGIYIWISRIPSTYKQYLVALLR